jgi:hypothetical protein
VQKWVSTMGSLVQMLQKSKTDIWAHKVFFLLTSTFVILNGVMVIVLAIGLNICGFKTGQER